MWRLRKTFTFEAAHHLPFHDGKCRRLHGHSWCMIVECSATHVQTRGPKTGMVIDYGDITAAVKPLLEDALDHWDLNASTGLESPTSELVAQWVYTRLKPVLPLLTAVTIAETCTSECRYAP